MNPESLVGLLKYIKENNGWGGNMYVNSAERHRRCIKYVDVCFDTRDGKIWRIVFRGVTSVEPEKSFRIESEKDLKRVYEYLDEAM